MVFIRVFKIAVVVIWGFERSNGSYWRFSRFYWKLLGFFVFVVKVIGYIECILIILFIRFNFQGSFHAISERLRCFSEGYWFSCVFYDGSNSLMRIAYQ